MLNVEILNVSSILKSVYLKLNPACACGPKFIYLESKMSIIEGNH